MGSSHGRERTQKRVRGTSLTHSARGTFESMHEELLPSLYHQRVALLAGEAATRPPAETLEATIRRCIAFCYGVTEEWAPHVRITAFADNPAEHQMNVPVYDTLLVAWGEPGFEALEVRCMPVHGTDVMYGHVVASPFWSRMVSAGAHTGRAVPCRALIHQILHWFLCLEDGDARKQLLVNMLLQLHEACFNCIGRHKEVFEYCVYDLAEAEAQGYAATFISRASLVSPGSKEADVGATEAARQVVRNFAARALDRHKRASLHAVVISPLKFLYQDKYEVFENLDSHGASFWAAVLTDAFFPGLEMPFESVVDLDGGWTWGAVDFLPAMLQGPPSDQEALRLLSAPENLGGDWRRLTAKLRPSCPRPRRLPGLPRCGEQQFRQALREAQREGSPLRLALEPYVARFAGLMAQPLLLRRCALQASISESWDLDLGPALASLSKEALGVALGPGPLRERLCLHGSVGHKVGHKEDALAAADGEAMGALLRAAGVSWA